MAFRNVLISSKKFFICIFCLMLSYSFFFAIRRVVLRVSGAKIGRGVTIHRGVYFYSFGNLVVGSSTTINPNCIIDNRLPIFIGENVNISHSVQIYTLGHDIDDEQAKLKGAPVHVEDNVWIFPNALIMPGVKLGIGCVVYPGSVVTKSVEPFSVVGGNPARHIKYRKAAVEYRLNNSIHFSL